MNTRLMSLGVCVLVVAALSGCALGEKKDEKAAQSMPVNCKAAPGDLRILTNEKATVASRIGNGVSMIAPIGLVEGLVTGTESTKYQVTTGEYNKALDTKIAQIHAACPGVTAD